jgi:arabinofuranan 3-O-arabinosyltransferase
VVVRGSPSRLFRVDSLTLRRAGSTTTGVTRAVTVTRDGRGTPTSVTVPDRSTDTLLTLPQNFNEGWTATWHGEELPAQRVDGWKQGWRLPAGSAGAVTLGFAPARTFTWLLGVGAVLVGVCVLAVAWLWWRDRRGLGAQLAPALRTGRPGLLDATVAAAAGGLLCGWWGLAGVATAIGLGLALRRFQGWPVLAGLSILVASLALAWAPITDRTWAVSWSQGWSLAAVCCAVAGLASLRTVHRHRAGQEPGVTVPTSRDRRHTGSEAAAVSRSTES